MQELQFLTSDLNLDVELIIVNDGSEYGTGSTKTDFIKKHHSNFKFISLEENRGKGFALRAGVKEASAHSIVFTDIDFPYTRESFLSVVNALDGSANLVAGNRGKAYYLNTPLLRKWISKTLRKIMKTFLKLPVDDTQCGIKGFDEKGKEVFLSTEIDRFLFDLEFIKIASKRKLKVSPIKVQLKEGVIFSKVKFSILFRESLNFIKILFKK